MEAETKKGMETVECRIDKLITDTSVRFKKLVQVNTIVQSIDNDFKFYKEKRA